MLLSNIQAVEIRFVKPEKMRYDTVGDWQFNHEKLVIKVADPEYTPVMSVLLVALHELVEAILCDADGISQQAVDAWDKTHADDDDPGGNPAAPYHKQHMAAELIERLMAKFLGVSWHQHDKTVEHIAAIVHEAQR
jgi:hypothetical protein